MRGHMTAGFVHNSLQFSEYMSGQKSAAFYENISYCLFMGPRSSVVG
jgi:hypothetical protein